jgi:hypothetical protein
MFTGSQTLVVEAFATVSGIKRRSVARIDTLASFFTASSTNSKTNFSKFYPTGGSALAL